MKNLHQVILNNVYNPLKIPVFIVIIFLLAFFLICIQIIQAGEIYTYKDKNGKTVISNTPIPDKYKTRAQKIDSYRESSLFKKNELEKGAVNRAIDKQIEEIDRQIYSLSKDPSSRSENGGIKKTVVNQIIKLRELKADIISKAQRLAAERRNPEDTGLKMRNQQDEMETKMKRQQMDMGAMTEEMKDKKRAMEAKMRSQEREIRELERDKRMSEHNQRMQEMNKALGQ
ncbi:MAG: DUF4124 domain-containing protein [Proteobacteria bacterium]|nr:DUF4124 domain-containing protein [Pseudomonadota bacterium]